MINYLRRFVRAIETKTLALSKSIKARVLYNDNDKLKENEIARNNVAYAVPSDVDPDSVYLADNLTQFEEIAVMESVTDKENKIKENDVSDEYIDYSNDDKKPAPTLPKYPDSYRKAIYPAGKSSPTDQTEGGKPNIQMIRKWVEDVKLAGKSQRELEMEYNTMYEQDSLGVWDNKKMDRLVKSIAFVVSRKIWYVGRKPSSMSDSEWDNDTRHMRPDDQSYSKGEKGKKYGYDAAENWGDTGNPYIQDEYSYTSGDPDERGRKK